MRPLTACEQEVAEALALTLADAFSVALPALFAAEPEAVIGFTLSLARSLIRLEAKAARNNKHAKRYRRAQRQVRELMRTAPESAAGVPDLVRTIAFDPASWHMELRPGAGHPDLLEADQ